MILVTGSSGFIGGALVERLAVDHMPGQVVAMARQTGFACPDGVRQMHMGDLLCTTDWSSALEGVRVVVHCAARVHVISDKNSDHSADFHSVNVESTVAFARQAAVAGVKRFVFLSSAKVNGEFTQVGQLFTEGDAPAPEGPYSVSKHEAEKSLRHIAAETGMEVVIIRPPLVYGPGVKANFESMVRWLKRGVPLPLAAVTQNRRSLVALDNLVDLIMTCLNHPAAANETFLVSDGDDLSTVQLLKRMGAAIGRPVRLFYVKPALLKLGAGVLSRPGIYQRLCGSLQLDITKTRQLLGWTPPVTVAEGLRRTAEGFR